MGFGFGNKGHKEVSAQQLDAMIGEGRVQIVDVREPEEFDAGHIPGAINIPLSAFRASQLPEAQGKLLVLSCAGGKRSAMALDQCAAVQAMVDTHLAGAFGAWQAAHLPIER